MPAEGGQSFYRARFTADDEIAYAWQQAMKGELSDAQKAWFRQLADHELAERGFMSQGIPYRNPNSWNPANEMWESLPPGAHDLAPAAPGYGRFPGFSDWYDNFFN